MCYAAKQMKWEDTYVTYVKWNKNNSKKYEEHYEAPPMINQYHTHIEDDLSENNKKWEQ